MQKPAEIIRRIRSKRIRKISGNIKLFRGGAGDGSFGHLVASRLWPPDGKFIDRERLFIDSGSFNMPVFQANVVYSAIS